MQAAFDWLSRRQRPQPCATALYKAFHYSRTSTNGHLSTTATFWRTVHTLTQRPLPFVPMVERFNCSKKRKNILFSARFLLLPAQSSGGRIGAGTEDKAQNERISSLIVMVFLTSIKQFLFVVSGGYPGGKASSTTRRNPREKFFPPHSLLCRLRRQNTRWIPQNK